MNIIITFITASNYVEIDPRIYINYVEKGGKYVNPDDYQEIDKIGMELKTFIEDTYFGGAQAVVYFGYNANIEEYYYQLIPG